MKYAELQVTSNFSFLRGASHPEEIVQQAAELGLEAIAITDIHSLAGIVRAHTAAKEAGIRFIPGCQLHPEDGPALTVLPINHQGYTSVCRLLSIGNLRTEKGSCRIDVNDVLNELEQVILIIQPPKMDEYSLTLPEHYKEGVGKLAAVFPGDLYLGMEKRYDGNDQKLLFLLHELSLTWKIPPVATNNVYYHTLERRQLQDVVTCIREKATIHSAGQSLYPNAERYLKAPVEMHRLFRQYPTALQNTIEITERCRFSLDELRYEYPEEIVPEGRTPMEELSRLVEEGAINFYGQNIPEKITRNMEQELAFIKKMDYAPYFLTVHDIVRYARDRGILCQGRGSAANSTVCFLLGITSVDPANFDLLFERFLSEARKEPPDIDVDFEHERREEVIQYIYSKYGRNRAAIVATVTCQQEKGAIRDVAKALGLSADLVDKLASSMLRSEGELNVQLLKEAGFRTEDPMMQQVIHLTQAYIGFPRQLGQHTGGFIISRHDLSQLCPILPARMPGRTCIEWNKDDIEALGFLKIDVLALGMLTCIRKAFDLIRQEYGTSYSLATIPREDPSVYEMISRADTIGVFQIESRAQQAMLPRLQPRSFYDLVIEVAIVRPGPIQGDMVHPYLKRRNGQEPVSYPSKELESILGRTLGIPLFQEQAMKVAIVAASFTPTEADALRRSMATFKAKGLVSHFEKKLVSGMLKNGYTDDYAKKVFRQLEGFGSYGFPESHAASFAQLVYVSAWLKCHYPAAFTCALLNSLPMGFYQPAQLLLDAQKHGVEVLPVDINHSEWEHKLMGSTIQLGFRIVKGIGKADIHLLVKSRTCTFAVVRQCLLAGLSTTVLTTLAEADAFRSMGLDRRQTLWELSVKDIPSGLFSDQDPEPEGTGQLELPSMSLHEQVMHDYATASLSLKAHPIQFIREKLGLLHAVTNSTLVNLKPNEKVKIAGLVLVRQRPGTAKGVWFITLEDETEIANLVIFKDTYEKYRKEIHAARVLLVEGRLQKENNVIHLLVTFCQNISKLLIPEPKLSLPSLSRADEVTRPIGYRLPPRSCR